VPQTGAIILKTFQSVRLNFTHSFVGFASFWIHLLLVKTSANLAPNPASLSLFRRERIPINGLRFFTVVNTLQLVSISNDCQQVHYIVSRVVLFGFTLTIFHKHIFVSLGRVSRPRHFKLWNSKSLLCDSSCLPGHIWIGSCCWAAIIHNSSGRSWARSVILLSSPRRIWEQEWFHISPMSRKRLASNWALVLQIGHFRDWVHPRIWMLLLIGKLGALWSKRLMIL